MVTIQWLYAYTIILYSHAVWHSQTHGLKRGSGHLRLTYTYHYPNTVSSTDTIVSSGPDHNTRLRLIDVPIISAVSYLRANYVGESKPFEYHDQCYFSQILEGAYTRPLISML